MVYDKLSKNFHQCLASHKRSKIAATNVIPENISICLKHDKVLTIKNFINQRE